MCTFKVRAVKKKRNGVQKKCTEPSLSRDLVYWLDHGFMHILLTYFIISYFWRSTYFIVNVKRKDFERYRFEM